MKTNPLVELGMVGQSVWYDQMERALIDSGKLARLIEEDDLRGLTSNPTIFEKAIGGSKDYDEALHALAKGGADRDTIYDELVIDDIQRAADVFRPVFDRTDGHDGYCSLEVSPVLAHDAVRTASEARRLFERLGRPNVMIKIPATPAGIIAIEEAISDGINVNVTLIFSRRVYEEVIEAYIRGLERRVAAGKPVAHIASVASFFVSRIDAAIDHQIEERLETATGEDSEILRSLSGKAAIANAKLAYQKFRDRFDEERFARLRKEGARVQRPLWASTGTKNPAYSDVLYVESLIGTDTVNTIPPKTYEAFRDHGHVSLTLEQGMEEARETLTRLEDAGISLDAVTDQLTREGVESFAASFTSLMKTLDSRIEARS